MRSPEQIRAIFASYGRRGLPRGSWHGGSGEGPSTDVLNARDKMAKRLRGARQVIRGMRARLKAGEKVTKQELLRATKEARHLVQGHIRETGGVLARVRYARVSRKYGAANPLKPADYSKHYKPYEGGASGASKEYKRTLSRARYRAIKDLGMKKTPYGYE